MFVNKYTTTTTTTTTKKILSLWEFHSETNLGERSSASMTIPSKAGMHCIWHQAENKKNKATG